MAGHLRALWHSINSRCRKWFFQVLRSLVSEVTGAPKKPRPNRSIPNCVSHSAGDAGLPGATLRPLPDPPPWAPAPGHNTGPAFSNKMSWETRGRPPPQDETVQGAARGTTSEVGGGRRGAGGESCTTPLHPRGPLPPALPAAPILRPGRRPPRTARSQGGGDTRASEAPRSPLNTGPSQQPTFATRPRLPSPITRGACARLLELSAPAGLTQSGEPEGAGNRLLLDWRQKQPVGGRSWAPDVTWGCGYDLDSSQSLQPEGVLSRSIYPLPFATTRVQSLLKRSPPFRSLCLDSVPTCLISPIEVSPLANPSFTLLPG